MSKQLYRIREIMMRSQAPGPPRSVLWALVSHLNTKNTSDLLVWPSQAKLSRLSGVNERQVRNHLKKLEELGEIELHRRGIAGKSTNVYRIALAAEDFDVIEDDDNRQPAAGSEERETGNALPVCNSRNPAMQRHGNRQSAADRREKEEEAPSRPASEKDGEVRNIAEKREGLNPDVFPGNDPDIASGAVDGLLGDRAHERPEHLKSDPEFDQWLAEIRAANG